MGLFNSDTEKRLEAEIEEFRQFRDIGETFNYLGRTLIVTAHTETAVDLGEYARLRCDYADNDGVIRQISFQPRELPALIAQQGDDNA